SRSLDRQVGEIPGGGGGEPQVRVVGQQRLAGARVGSRDDPVVGGAAANEVVDGLAGRVLLDDAPALERIKLGQLRQWRGSVRGVVTRQQVLDLRRGEALGGQRQARHLVVEIGAQVQRHHLRRYQTVGYAPGL